MRSARLIRAHRCCPSLSPRPDDVSTNHFATHHLAGPVINGFVTCIRYLVRCGPVPGSRTRLPGWGSGSA